MIGRLSSVPPLVTSSSVRVMPRYEVGCIGEEYQRCRGLRGATCASIKSQEGQNTRRLTNLGQKRARRNFEFSSSASVQSGVVTPSAAAPFVAVQHEGTKQQQQQHGAERSAHSVETATSSASVFSSAISIGGGNQRHDGNLEETRQNGVPSSTAVAESSDKVKVAVDVDEGELYFVTDMM